MVYKDRLKVCSLAIILSATILSVNSAWAQQSASRKIALTPMVSEALELPSSVANTLQQKLTQMVLQNGMAAQDGEFVLTASYSVLDDLVAPADVAQYVVKLEVMFYIVNLVENIIVAENSCIVKGNGASREKAINKAFSSINPHSSESRALITNAKNNIILYYTDRSDVLIGKAQSFAKIGQYSEALAVLDPIPDCVPAYKEISGLKDDIFAQWIDLEAGKLISEAKRCIALGNYEDAFEAILNVNPLSSRFWEAEALSKEIDSRIIAAEKAAQAIAIAASEAKIKEKEAEIARANAEAEQARAAAAQANASEAQAKADAANAQAAISQSQLQSLKTLKVRMDKLSESAQKSIVDNVFKNETQNTYVAQAVTTVKPQQTLQEKAESLKKFLLGKIPNIKK